MIMFNHYSKVAASLSFWRRMNTTCAVRGKLLYRLEMMSQPIIRIQGENELFN